MTPHPCFYRGIPNAVSICGTCEKDLALEGAGECWGCHRRRVARECDAELAARQRAGAFWDGLPQHAALPASWTRAHVDADRRKRAVTYRIFGLTLAAAGVVFVWGFVAGWVHG